MEKTGNKNTYLGVGWINKTKDGKEFISCKINKEAKVITDDFLLFVNDRKREGKQDPDYNIVSAKQ